MSEKGSAQSKSAGARKNIHSGHRERVKERFFKEGLDGFADHNVLELMLFYSIHRKDTNELAHRLLETFGSFHAVLEADVERLTEVPGISYNTALMIKLFKDICKRYQLSRRDTGVVIDNAKLASDYVSALFIGEPEEVFYVISLNGAGKIIYADRLASGTVNRAQVDVRKVIDSVVKHKAESVLLAHNHPGAIAHPSTEDISVTETIEQMLDEMGVKLLDHMIVGSDGNVCSMNRISFLSSSIF